ncbi:MAG TPA: hypothetical protein VIR02_13790, partial [Anaerolineales bacterium]
MSTNIPSPWTVQSRVETEQEIQKRTRGRKVRNFLVSLTSHAAINFIGLFFLLPFLWMVITALKSSQDVFHTPPRWLPYDNVRVEVGGEQL